MKWQQLTQIISLTVSIVAVGSTSSNTEAVDEVQSFDYVVVGGGIGGGTIAHALAKRSNSVLLIEAGPDHSSEIIDTPFYHYLTVVDPNISFTYPVQFYSDGYLSNKTFPYSRVGSLGGCTRHNAMTAILPSTDDYESIVEATGDQSWSETVIRDQYFKKIERNAYPSNVNPEDHGFKGWLPINVVDFNQHFQLDSQMKAIHTEAFNKNNGKFVDINGYAPDGKKLNTDIENQFLLPMSIDENYKRYDFPKFIKDSKNLTVWTDTLVTKLVLDDDNKNVVQVNYAKGRYLYKASPLSSDENRQNAKLGSIKVNKEVILAAGAFNSPQLLMLSGIGPKKDLEQLDIEVKVNLEGVGKNLMDKSVTFIASAYEKEFNIYEECKFFTYNLTDPCYRNLQSLNLKNRHRQQLLLLNEHEHQKVFSLEDETNLEIKPSPYMSSGIIAGELFKTDAELESPDIFMVNVPGSARGPSILPPSPDADKLAEFNGTFIKTLFKVQPQDKGYVTLKTIDPFDTPKINFNKFNQAENGAVDLKALRQSLKLARQQFKKLEDIKFELVPGKNVDEDEEIEKFIKENMTGFHICCTNRVGKDDDKMAVLNKEFKVRGLNNLRVVDGSSFPQPPGFFPAVMTHIQSLKVADMMLNE